MKREKYIETSELLIRGNIMKWKGYTIQLSNVSCISTSHSELMEFPMSSVFLFISGCIICNIELLIESSVAFGVMLMLGGLTWIAIWFMINKERAEEKVLTITLNSGSSFAFYVRNVGFLYNEIIPILEQIIIDGGVGNGNISINIDNCKFSGDAKILNKVNVS